MLGALGHRVRRDSRSSRYSITARSSSPTKTPDYAQVLISARGNLSAGEKRDIVMRISRIAQTVPGIRAIYASSGGQSNNLNSQGGVPVDNIGRLGIEMKDYRERKPGKWIEEQIRQKTANIPGVHVEVREPQQGPPTGKDVMIDVSSDNYVELAQVTSAIRAHMDKMRELRDVEDTRPLPGIEWDLQINREVASRFGANAQSIGTAVQLVTNGILVGKYRPDDSQDEVDIRVRYPSESRGIHALDNLRVAAANGEMVPISNFVTLKPAQQVNSHRTRRRPSRLSRARQRQSRHQCQCRDLRDPVPGSPRRPSRTTCTSHSRAAASSRTNPARS